MSATAIEWTQSTWNPVTGCDRVSPGCAMCYALELAPRLRAMGVAKYQRARDGGRASGPAFGVTLHPDTLDQPLRWRRPRLIFVNSMSDLFHDEIPDEYIARVFAVMAAAPQHTFQVLTKRPERMRDFIGGGIFPLLLDDALEDLGRRSYLASNDEAPALPNVWLGVSIENRRFVGRADILRQVPAAVRFISAEPLLGPLIYDRYTYTDTRGTVRCWSDTHLDEATTGKVPPELDLTGIDWLIAGGESGPRHRPIQPEWVRDLRDAAASAGTAFFLKQWGGRTPKAGGRGLDGRTWDEMPVPPRRRPALAGGGVT